MYFDKMFIHTWCLSHQCSGLPNVIEHAIKNIFYLDIQGSILLNQAKTHVATYEKKLLFWHITNNEVILVKILI